MMKLDSSKQMAWDKWCLNIFILKHSENAVLVSVPALAVKIVVNFDSVPVLMEKACSYEKKNSHVFYVLL
jgi:hypothetical protein